MFGNLFKKRSGIQRRRTIRTPDDTVIWAIGDIHGRLDLLQPLVAEMLSDLAASSAERKVIVFLGDYVDRGPDSRGVIDLLASLPGRHPVEFHFLRGNHEDRMEAFLSDPAIGSAWCDYGGREALLSYGITAPSSRDDAEGWAAASTALNDAMGEAQKTFLDRQEMFLGVGDYFFVHAGAKPGVPLDSQSTHDLMWIRQSFLDDPRPFDRVVVHGHTPTEHVHNDHRRIGIDTGAYATGVLSALRLEGESRSLLQTAKSGSGIELSRRDV